MKTILIATVLLLYQSVLSQTERGASPIPSTTHSAQPGSTYAVVVGISDYQDEGIPDLRFADKDALAFANFLRSPAGGLLDAEHLRLLLNNEATMAQFAAALDWLWEVSKEGDQVIIYVSGHGDVEKKSLTQPGFLLCWDAPARVYMGGGAFALPMLQEVISTLSVQNKAKVVVITDACRSGNLAGQSVSGSQATAANLAKQYANEIKILSCQPNEYSIEGEQWGGGRGAFSFNLVDALYGMADGNGDLFVTLQEVGRYLEDHVTNEVAPVSQVPMVLGNRTERLANVDAKLLADLRSGKTSQMKMTSPVESRGLEDDVLAEADTTVRELYRLFKKAIKDKVFLEPAGACADTWYERLVAEPKLARLHSTMRRNYAAALQDDAQQVLNKWLTTTVASPSLDKNSPLPRKIFTEKVRLFPQCLERAAELLGSNHYMYNALKARKYFFEGYLLANSNLNIDRSNGESALELFRQSLEWLPEQPHVYWQMSRVFGTNILQADSLEYYTSLANEVHPNWIMPNADAAWLLSYKINQPDRAKPYLEQASRIDSNDVGVLNSQAAYFYSIKRFSETERLYKKAIALDSANAVILNNLGVLYLDARRYDEAVPVLKKAIALDTTTTISWSNLGNVYTSARRFAEAELVLLKSVEVDSSNSRSWGVLASFYYSTRRYAEAETANLKAISLDSTNIWSWNALGHVYMATNRFAEAEGSFKKAIELDSTISYPVASLASLYSQSGNPAASAPLFEKAIELDSTNAHAYADYAGLLDRLGHFEKAIEYSQKSIALDSMYLQSYNALGYAYMATGRLAEAEQTFVKGLSIFPTESPNPHRHLGMVYLKTDRPAEAHKSFLKAISINPNYVPAILAMAYVLSTEGNTAEAIGYLEQAIGKGVGFAQMENDPDLASLRATPEWKTLMKKYFPGQAKD